METWILALLMFALSIIPSVLNNKRKKKEAENAPPAEAIPDDEVPTRPDFFERMRELLEIEKEEAVEERPEEEIFSYDSVAVQEIEEERKDGFTFMTGISSEGSMTEVKATVLQDEVKDPEEEGPVYEDFDLRKAVIYQSVLENKYL